MSTRTDIGRHRHLLGFVASVLILLGVGAALYSGAGRSVRDAEQVAHSWSVLEQIGGLYSRVKDLEAAQRGYVLTGKPEYLGQFHAALPEIDRRGDALARGIADDPAQVARVAQLRALIAERTSHAEKVMAIFDRDGLEAAQLEIAGDTGRLLMERIATATREMEAGEQRLLGERRAAAVRSDDRLRLTALLGIGASLALMSLVYWLVMRENRERRLAERRTDEAGAALRRSVEELHDANRAARELSAYAGMLQGCRTLDEALGFTRRTFTSLLPQLGGVLYLSRASQDLCEERARWGEATVASVSVLAPGDCWALRRAQNYLVDDVRRGTCCAHVECGTGTGSTLCLPLSAQGDSLGFLYLSGPEQDAGRAQHLATAAAEQLSLALGNLRLQETLRFQSIRDPLTGLFNRRYLEESLERELARCGRRNQPLTLMMLDLDHFKRFNDAHGHDGGDALLRGFASLLQAHCRSDDTPCRFGGEEFTLILPEMDPEVGLERAEAIRVATESMRLQHLREPLMPVTVSIGLASFPRNGVNAAELLRIADGALYRAKHDGRNRIATA